MAEQLEPKLTAVLVRLAEIDDERYETFVPAVTGESEGKAELVGSGTDELFEPGQLKELATRGHLEMEATGNVLGKFRLTPKGRRVAAEAQLQADGTVDLSWSEALRVLGQIHEHWKHQGANPAGDPGDAAYREVDFSMPEEQFGALVRALEKDGWVDATWAWQGSLPLRVQPTQRAISLLEGWPTEDRRIVGEQFIARLEAQIDDEPDAEKQSKMRQGLSMGGSALREFLIDTAAAIAARQSGLG
jgi:hypothetical protein